MSQFVIKSLSEYSKEERYQIVNALIEINPEVDRHFFSGYTHSDELDCYVLEKDDEVFGYACIAFYDNSFNLDDIIIDANYRSKGYGKTLIDYIVNKYMLDADNDDCYDSFTLECNTLNKDAIVFYTKYGFTINGFIYNYYGNGESAICMTFNTEAKNGH